MFANGFNSEVPNQFFTIHIFIRVLVYNLQFYMTLSG